MIGTPERPISRAACRTVRPWAIRAQNSWPRAARKVDLRPTLRGGRPPADPAGGQVARARGVDGVPPPATFFEPSHLGTAAAGLVAAHLVPGGAKGVVA